MKINAIEFSENDVEDLIRGDVWKSVKVEIN